MLAFLFNAVILSFFLYRTDYEKAALEAKERVRDKYEKDTYFSPSRALSMKDSMDLHKILMNMQESP